MAEQFRGNKQLINTKIYEERQQQKLKAMEMTAKKHLQARNQKEQTRLAQHFQGQVGATVGAPREMIISDLRFRLTDDGSKLIRIFGALLTNLQAAGSAAELSFADGNTSVEATPKQAKIVGVTFRRTKHGNLVRDGIVKEKRYRIWTGAAEEVADPYIATCRPPKVKKSTQLCPKFSNYGTSLPYQQRTGGARKKTTNRTAPTAYSAGKPQFSLLTRLTGTCPFGDRCKLTHDFNKLAICKDYLRSGECPAGDACDLSHDPTPHRVPMCMYFLRGECTNEHCRYAHVRHDINPAAPVCRAFVTLGYCDKGAQCTERHVIECPDYANTGRCRKPEGECRLPHVDRAGVLRKAAAKKARKGSDEDSDLSSDEGNYDEIDQDDVDSDGLDDEDVAMGGSDDDSHQLTQQQDFIAFS